MGSNVNLLRGLGWADPTSCAARVFSADLNTPNLRLDVCLTRRVLDVVIDEGQTH